MMSAMELMCLKDQRSERKLECDKGVDSIWYRVTMRQQDQGKAGPELYQGGRSRTVASHMRKERPL